MGRPPKLTPDTIKAIADTIRVGNFLDAAAAHAGVAPSTAYNWQARGRAELARVADIEAEGRKASVRASERLYVEFAEAVENARLSAEVGMTTRIAAAARDPKHWQAAAWWLERTNNQRWGRVQRTEVSGPNGGPVRSETVATQAEIEAKARALLPIAIPGMDDDEDED